MLYALNNNQDFIGAEPKREGQCPGCRAKLIPKCGEIVTWHWAHRVSDCDPWHEPETAWHLGWKSQAPPDWCEVSMGPHRADVRRPDGTVIEFQHSSISAGEIREREEFWGRVIWLVDASKFSDNVSLRHRDGYYTFRWYWPRTSWAAARGDTWLDFGDSLFELRKVHWDGYVGGWGRLHHPDTFTRRWLNGAREKAA